MNFMSGRSQIGMPFDLKQKPKLFITEIHLSYLKNVRTKSISD